MSAKSISSDVIAKGFARETAIAQKLGSNAETTASVKEQNVKTRNKRYGKPVLNAGT